MLILDSSEGELSHNIVLSLKKYPLSESGILNIANVECINDEVRKGVYYLC